MHIHSFRSLLLLIGFTFLVHSLTIPNGNDLAVRNDRMDLADVEYLDRRAPPKKTPKAGSKPPLSTPKSTPKISQVHPSSTPASTPKSTPKTSQVPPSSTPASTSKSSPSAAPVNSAVKSSSLSSSLIISFPSSVPVQSTSASLTSGLSSRSSATNSVLPSTGSGSITTSSASGSITISSATGPLPTSLPPCTASGTKSGAKPGTKSGGGSCASKTLPVIKFPRETKAVDVCLLPNVDCYSDQYFDDAKGIVDDQDLYVISTNDTEPATSKRSVTKRNSRPYPGIDLGTAGTMSVRSLGYPSPGDLFSTGSGAKLTPHAFSYTSNSLSSYKVKDYGKVQATGNNHGWVVEHIIELQSVKMFIEYAVKAGVPGDFFKHYWNADVTMQKVFDNRKWRPAYLSWPGHSLSFGPGDRTLNNIVFQALGSNYNRNDFVLCEAGINSFKESAWAKENFMDLNKFKMYAQDAAKGALGADYFLTPLRTVLAVYAYFNEPVVAANLKEESDNVQRELGNLPYLWDLSQNVGWPTFNLSALWYSWLSNHLSQIRDHGFNWLNAQLKVAEDAYDNEIAALTQKYHATAAEEHKWNVPHQPQYWNHYVALQEDKREKIDVIANGPKAQPGQPPLQVGGLAAKYAQAKQAANVQDAKVAGMASGKDKEKEKRLLAKAEQAVYDALKAWRLEERKKSYLFTQSIELLINQAKADRAIVKTFRDAQQVLKMPKI